MRRRQADFVTRKSLIGKGATKLRARKHHCLLIISSPGIYAAASLRAPPPGGSVLRFSKLRRQRIPRHSSHRGVLRTLQLSATSSRAAPLWPVASGATICGDRIVGPPRRLPWSPSPALPVSAPSLRTTKTPGKDMSTGRRGGSARPRGSPRCAKAGLLIPATRQVFMPLHAERLPTRARNRSRTITGNRSVAA